MVTCSATIYRRVDVNLHIPKCPQQLVSMLLRIHELKRVLLRLRTLCYYLKILPAVNIRERLKLKQSGRSSLKCQIILITQEVQVTQKRLSLLTITETRLSCVHYLVNVDNK